MCILGQIVLDVCAYTDGSIMGTLSLEKLRQDYANSMTFVDGVQLKRFVLPLNVDKNVRLMFVAQSPGPSCSKLD